MLKHLSTSPMVFCHINFIYYHVINLRKVKNAIDQYRINILLF